MMRYFIAALSIYLAQDCYAQKKFTTEIRFPANIDTRKVIMQYDNGKTVYPVATTFNENKATISGTFYSKYVMLAVLYRKPSGAFYSNEYFLNEGSSSLVFAESKNGDTPADPLDSCKLLNAIEIRKLPAAVKMRLFTAKETSQLDEIMDYYDNKTNETNKDSVMQVMHERSGVLVKKQLEFVKKYNDQYYSFWVFKRNISGTNFIKPDVLSKVFASFPAAVRNSFEGKETVRVMNGIVHANKGLKAPAFSANDITGVTINTGNYRGKYILLQFWASWCRPCLQEMPSIRKIRDNYSADRLEVISISIDSDSSAFAKAMGVHKINWTTIFDRQREIYTNYGGKPIPLIYLINKEGVIVYSSEEDRPGVLVDLLSRSVK
ncbi:hypothetical protein A3860_09040 [Niastella vici]|uniref:Thioredoxin domain-containing protein n=1 Tax=Niastella vici TaxID=1703345 RepID=A0A1V9FHL8_9BACT|nr:TlpA disulfide reductase family protein [Niastella vici]OQP57761.1 hypothetical protein A3860_09040 [Niastella vici]